MRLELARGSLAVEATRPWLTRTPAEHAAWLCRTADGWADHVCRQSVLEARAIVRARLGLAFPDLELPGYPGQEQLDPVHPLRQAERRERDALSPPAPPYRPRHAVPQLDGSGW